VVLIPPSVELSLPLNRKIRLPPVLDDVSKAGFGKDGLGSEKICPEVLKHQILFQEDCRNIQFVTENTTQFPLIFEYLGDLNLKPELFCVPPR